MDGLEANLDREVDSAPMVTVPRPMLALSPNTTYKDHPRVIAP